MAAGKPPKEPKQKVKKGRQVEAVQPIPEPPVIVPEAAPEPAFEPAIQAPAEEAPEREPIELDSEPVVLGPAPSFAELVEETPAEEEAEPEPELPPAPGMGFILREMAETPADEQLPAGEPSLASLAPPPKPEEPVASAEPPVPEEPPAQKAPLASLSPEPSEDVVSPPGYLGIPPEEEEEDLGAHEPKVFDVGAMPEEEPVELPAAQEPEVFDLEEEPAPEPEPVELESVVEEPQTLGVAEVEEEPEPVEIEPAAYRRRVFDFGVVPKAPPAPTPMAEVEAPEVSEEAIDLSAVPAIEEAEEELPELAPIVEEEVSEEAIDLSAAPEVEEAEEESPELAPTAEEETIDLTAAPDLEEAEAEEELPEPPPAESLETETEPALEEKELEPAATAGLVDADSPAPSPVETVEAAEPEAEQAPQVEAPEPPEDVVSPLGYLGISAEEEEEDLGAHEPKVFDLGAMPEEEPTEPEPIELEPSVHEPKAFDVGEVLEEEPTEPEPIELEPSVHEPKVFDLGAMPEEEPAEPEPIELEPSVHEPKTFDVGEVLEEEPAESEPIELEPSVHEPKVFDLGAMPEEEPAEAEPVELPAAQEPEVFDLEEEPAPEPEPEPVAEEPAPEPKPVELESVVEEPQTLGVAEVEEEPELEPEPIELEPVEEPQTLDVTEVAEEEPEPVEIETAAYRRRVFDLGVVPKAPPAPTPMAEVEAPEVSEEAVDLSAAPEVEKAEEELPEPPPAESSETEIEPALEEKKLEPAAIVRLVDADSPAPSPVETVEAAEPQAEKAPLVQAPDLPVFDIESIEESPEVEEEEPPTRHRPRSPLPGLAVTLILLLLSAWRLMNSYPPPGAVASNFVKAVDSMMAGNTTALSRVVSADSQQDMGQITEIFQPFQKKRLEIRITPKEVVRREITGNSANVVVLTNLGIPDAVQAQGRLTVALVKEGSAIRKRWKVDLTKTGEDWKTELPQLLKNAPQGEP